MGKPPYQVTHKPNGRNGNNVGKILSINLHTFGNTSGKGAAAVVYAVVEQPSGTNVQGLVMAKLRSTKKGLMMP